jgi:hypothetical protein
MPAFAVQPQAPAFAGRAGRCSGTPAVRLRSRPGRSGSPRAAAGHWPSVSPRRTRRAYHHRRRSCRR